MSCGGDGGGGGRSHVACDRVQLACISYYSTLGQSQTGTFHFNYRYTEKHDLLISGEAEQEVSEFLTGSVSSDQEGI